MMEFVITQGIDLRRSNPVYRYDQAMECGDAAAHLWCVTLKDGGKRADLSGASAKCFVMRAAAAEEKAQGITSVTVIQDAQVDAEKGVVSCLLDKGCYAGVGAITGIMRVYSATGGVMAAAKMTAMLERNTSEVMYDPDDAIPSIDELLSQIAAMEAATKAASEAAAAASDAADVANMAAQSANFVVLGQYDTLDLLQAAHPVGKAGQAWAIGTKDPYNVHVWDVDRSEWHPIGELQGAAGRGVVKVERITGSQSPGEYDRYRMVFTDGTSFEYSIYNGKDYEDIKLSIYPLTSIKTQDCILIQYEGRNILVDTGTISVEEDPDAPVVLVDKLRALGAEHIDMICISHYHNDHCGLPEMVAAGLDIKGATLILPQEPDSKVVNESKHSSIYRAYQSIKALADNESYELSVTEPYDGLWISLAEEGDTHFEFFNCDHDVYYGVSEENFDYNNCSMIALLVHGTQRILLSGDLAMDAQAAMVGKLPRVNLYKLEHHGLNAKFNSDFYATISPEMCFTCNGIGKAARTSAYIFSRSAVQAYLERMGIANFCTHDNDNLHFVVGLNAIEVFGRSFNRPTNIVHHTSVMSAVDAEYTPLADIEAMSFRDLCVGMKPDTHLVTQIDDGFAMWELIRPFMSSDIGSATLDLYKVSSGATRGSIDATSGYFKIYPRSGKSTTIGEFFGTFYYDPTAKPAKFNTVIKQINPTQVHHFTWGVDEKDGKRKFIPTKYSGNAFVVNGEGEIQSTYSGLCKIWVTATNKSSASKLYTIEDSANNASSRVRATVNCAENYSVSMAHMESIAADSVIGIRQNGALLTEADEVTVMIESLSRYQGYFAIEEVDEETEQEGEENAD